MKTESSCRKAYRREVERQYDPYKQWIEEYEKEQLQEKYSDLSYRIVFMEECVGNWDVIKYDEDIIILYSMKGELDERATGVILQYMEEHKEVALAYADEDYLVDEYLESNSLDPKLLFQIGVDVEHCGPSLHGRIAPWFKPDFSPDTLLAFQYFGNIVALRTSKIRGTKVDPLTGPEYTINLYDFFLKVSEKAKIGHISEILYHRHGVQNYTLPHGTRKKYNTIKLEALKRRGQLGRFVTDEEGYTHIIYAPQYHPSVSIIIPSKDHPELVHMCVESIRKKTHYSQLEILVIDNGSANNHRLELEDLAKKFGFVYHYEPMDFNFSKMCNIGAELAKGELLLFLNDDIEVLDENWLEILSGQAMLPHVGAVGAKLLYPNSTLIQHVGISNSIVGPVHRLHNYSDDNSMYYGRNRMTYDEIGVTAACLMIRKSVFHEVDGFCEEIKVAYNDVDLCFKLFEKGYSQVIRNDVKLYHHESISRGRDLAGEKKQRLDAERTLLYERHPNLSPKKLEGDLYASIDPYCKGTQHWKRNSLFMPGYQFESERIHCYTIPEEIKNRCYVDSVTEYVIKDTFLRNPKGKIFDRSHIMMCLDSIEKTNEQVIMIGWTLLTQNDNALFTKRILLKNEQQQVFMVNPFTVLREDVAQYIEGQTNVLLSGITLRFPTRSLPKGRYQIGALFTSQIEKRKYAEYFEYYLEIEE